MSIDEGMMDKRHVSVAYGSESYYQYANKGYRRSAPIGDVTGMCIMVPPGSRPMKGFAYVVLKRCDVCGKFRRDLKSMGRDGNGEPDAPDMCFFCRKSKRAG